jgi:hypothetical protein
MLLFAHTEAEESEEEADEDEDDEDDEDEDWFYPEDKNNQHYIVSFMKYTKKIEYHKDYKFNKQELLTIKPCHVRRWLNFLAYGTPKPRQQHRPTRYRSGSLKKAKGGVSVFMPNRSVKWIEGRGGNPTIHQSLSNLIKKVQKFEVRNQGKAANVKRGYTHAEFKMLIKLLRQAEDFESTTFTLWQKHLIHRVDDTAHVPSTGPHGCINFEFAIQTRTRWSKNVTCYSKCPDQILFGSDDWTDCILINLASYLERRCGMSIGTKAYLFAKDNDEAAPARYRKSYLSRLTKHVWESEEFKALDDQVGADEDRFGLGGHSTRKYASTRANKLGGTHSQIEGRGRWVGVRGTSICSKHYIDVENPFDDAFIARLLCDGGAVAYELTDTSVSDDWLYQNVIPNIYDHYNHDKRLCKVLALALLWAVFNPDARDGLKLGVSIRDKFVDDHQHIVGVSPTNYSPVAKVRLKVYACSGKLMIEKDPLVVVSSAAGGTVNRDQDGGPTGTNSTTDGAAANGSISLGAFADQATLHHLLSIMQELVRTVNEGFQQLSAANIEAKNDLGKQLTTVNRNLRLYGGTVESAFANQLRHNGVEPSPNNRGLLGVSSRMDPKATLCDRPRDLQQLWNEWMAGIGGRKPAKSFTLKERSNPEHGIKQKYWRRLQVWKIQARLIDAGHSIYSANALILQTTGAKSVTQVINRILQFKKVYESEGGVHPALRISP